MRDLLLKNLPWKLLSLLIALLLWFSLVGEQELTTATSVPIVLRNIPRDLEISSDIPDRVHIEIQGPVGRISHLADPVVILDLSGVSQPGERTFPIRQANLNLPPGVTLSRSVPAQVRLRFERRTTRQVPVHVRIAAPPPPGYRIVRQDVQPSSVTVIGAESRVARVPAVETDSIDVSTQVGETEYRVNLYVPDEHVRIPDITRVSVRIMVQKQEK